jgi:hypothetical protein
MPVPRREWKPAFSLTPMRGEARQCLYCLRHVPVPTRTEVRIIHEDWEPRLVCRSCDRLSSELAKGPQPPREPPHPRITNHPDGGFTAWSQQEIAEMEHRRRKEFAEKFWQERERKEERERERRDIEAEIERLRARLRQGIG